MSDTPKTDAFREVIISQYKEDECTGNGMGKLLAALTDIESLELALMRLTTTNDNDMTTMQKLTVEKNDPRLCLAGTENLWTVCRKIRDEVGFSTEVLAENVEHADAVLFAAAPDMLDALRRLTHPMASDDDLTHALAVITKAEGRGA